MGPQPVVWDRYNRIPNYRSLPPEILFIGSGSGPHDAFIPDDEITSGMQELVALYGGVLKPKEGAHVDFVPLLSTGPDSNTALWMRLVQRSLFGVQISTICGINRITNAMYCGAHPPKSGDTG